ncbi:MAG: hypothetical protein Q9223_002230 [Gallowayella weberi]
MDELSSGFGALLELVQELDKKNANLEQLLDRMHEQIWSCSGSGDREHTYRLTFVLCKQAHRPFLQTTVTDLVPTQIVVIDTTSSITHAEDSYLKAQKHINDTSGLHVECEDNQLHLHKVPEDTKWLIADGFKAWNILRSDGIGQSLCANEVPKQYQDSQTQVTQHPVMAKTDASRCPFASLQSTAPNPHAPSSKQNSHVSLFGAHPDRITKDPIAAESHTAKPSSQRRPSQPDSATKCPIRFLDQHSPEEVAEYFTNHRHEIPRSHEICVKRYQKNEDQIRLLDHKYGSLVNMIQGLGQKHQPMLQTKVNDGNESISRDQVSQEKKVEAWAQEVDNGDGGGHNGVHIKVEPVNDDEAIIEDREGHFDRPLKEIRVGESPSRPWGISVPHGAHIPASAVSHHPEKRGAATFHPPEPPTPPAASSRVRAEAEISAKSLGRTDRQPNMIFTGPVFVGYAPDQIVDILQRTGLGKGNGP